VFHTQKGKNKTISNLQIVGARQRHGCFDALWRLCACELASCLRNQNDSQIGGTRQELPRQKYFLMSILAFHDKTKWHKTEQQSRHETQSQFRVFRNMKIKHKM
jgi:hypothetical protein